MHQLYQVHLRVIWILALAHSLAIRPAVIVRTAEFCCLIFRCPEGCSLRRLPLTLVAPFFRRYLVVDALFAVAVHIQF